MRPGLDAGQTNAQAPKIGIWIQNLCSVDTPRDGRISSIDHVELLGRRLVDIMDVAVRRVPARPGLIR